MTKLAELKREVESLPPAEYDAFRQWFEEREAKFVDDWLEGEIKAGRFDDLAKRALEDEKAGRSHDL